MLKQARESLSIFSTLVALLLILSGEVLADVVILETGDRLTGVVSNMEENTLTLTTDYSKPIKIQKIKIKEIFTDSMVEIYLAGGEVLKGRLKTSEDGKLLVESSTGREQSVIDWNEVTAVNPKPVPSTQWDGNVTVGAGLQSGNTDRANASLGTEATRKTDNDRFSLRFLFNYAEENDNLTTRNTFGALKYDYFFTEVLFGYLAIELLNDKFKDLSLRTVVGPGVGYQVWDSPMRFLIFEAGISYFSENLSQGDDTSWVTARVAGKLRYKILENISFSDHLVVYPSIEEFGEYQLRNEGGISSDLGAGWSLNLINILERDSNPPAGVKKNDLQWIAGLKYSF
jgi:putative salt-induced outer membrane protein YdiY